MAVKKVEVEGLGSVLLAKRRGTKNLRLTVSHEGRVRVSLPAWMPYAAGLAFIRKHRQWIDKQRHGKQRVTLRSGQMIGAFRLKIHAYQSRTRRSRITPGLIELWTNGDPLDEVFQLKAMRICERALYKQAAEVLPPIVDDFSQRLNLAYKSLRVKKLTSRWGSCSSRNDITLNMFLLQLPRELRNYVIVHELVHTKHPHHGPSFWAAMKAALPDAMKLRKALRRHPPALLPVEDAYVS